MDPYSKTSQGGYLARIVQRYNDTVNGPHNQVTVYSSGKNLTDTFSGYRNPFWRDEIRQGGNATTPANGVKWFVPDSYLSYQIDFDQLSGTKVIGSLTIDVQGYPFMDESWLAVPSPTSDVVNSVTARAIARFLDRIDSARSSFEAGQDIGEVRETLHSIIHPLSSARDLALGYLGKLRKLNRKTLRNKVSLQKAIADTYLEFRFGWDPLAADIGQGIASLTNNVNHVDTIPVSASASLPYYGSSVKWRALGGNPFLGAIDTSICKTTGIYQVRYKGAVRTGAVNGKIPLLQNLQLDIPHFVPTLWDLLPYSWIADYFANIGDIIRAASFRYADLTWGVVTTRKEALADFSLNLKVDDSYNRNLFRLVNFSSSPCNPSSSSITFSRARLTPSDLIPPFVFNIPLTARPWENMTALLVSRGSSASKYLSSLFK
jgi:hypothetical protein